MVRITLIAVVAVLAWIGGTQAYAWHGMEMNPGGLVPADRIVLPSFSSGTYGQPALAVGEPGDVNGDGRDDLAISFPGWYSEGAPVYVVFGRPAGQQGPEAVTERPGFRIDGAGTYASAAAAGDLNRDGLGDIAVTRYGEVVVVFGKRDGSPVHLDELGRAGLRIQGVYPGSGGAGNGVAEPAQIVDAGDQNGDGRHDLAIASGSSIRIVFTPADPAGAVVDAAEESQGVTLHTHSNAWKVQLASLGDAWGDERGELLVGWEMSDDSGIRLVGVGLPAFPTSEIDLRTVAGAGLGWELSEPGRLQSATALRPAAAGGPRRPLVSVDHQTWLLPALGPGRTGSISSEGLRVEGSTPIPIDVGDQDRDGDPDIGMYDFIRYAGETGGGIAFPYVQEAWSQLIASPGDTDGDGFREVVVSRVDHDNVYDVAPANAARWSLDVYHSRSWPHDHDRGRLTSYPLEGWRPPYAVPPPSGARPTPPRGTSRRNVFDISETPVYLRGGIDVALRSARGSTAVARATATGWRPGSPSWELPEATARSAGNPWVKLAFALPAPARQALEADGRLRMTVALTLRSSSGRVTHETVPMVVVTRPRPGAFGAQRRLRGSFGVQRLLGGPLADLITGASADDMLRGGAGADALHGGTGDDTLFGDAGGDLLDGDDGDDRLDGGPGNDQVVELRFGDDHLAGGEGDDFVSGGRGVDTVSGGPGDDILAGGSGPDQVSCGAGEDIVFVNFSAERSRVKGCEHVYDEPGVIHAPCTDGGTASAETLLGTEDDDYCVAGDGGDDLEGRGGNDVLVGQGGNDRMFGRFGRDTLDGGEGNDELEGGRGRDLLRGGPGNDRLNGGYDDDRVAGGAGDDRIVARGGGVDVITCGPGVDTVYADSRDRLAGCERVHRSGRPRR